MMYYSEHKFAMLHMDYKKKKMADILLKYRISTF